MLSARKRLATMGAALLALLAFAGVANAQATRTYVSGVGDDANPCSRTAPCKTFAGAISKTASGGEIDALDPGGYGAVTITKSITIDGGGGWVSGVLVSGTNGVNVAAAPTDRVVLRNLTLNGIGGQGLDAVKFTSGASLKLQNDVIYGFGDAGVEDVNGATNTLVVSNSTIQNNNGDGVEIDATAATTALLENDAIESNACGVVVSTASNTACSSGGSGSATATISSSSISANSGDAVLASGSGAKAYITGNLIAANPTGLDEESGGQILSVCGNVFAGNTTDGSATTSSTSGCAVTSGPTGPQGATGASGPTGASGLTGANGATGPRGAAGSSGANGKNGKSGKNGKNGTNGRNGQIEFVTCRRVHRTTLCSAQLVSGLVTFKRKGRLARGVLSRHGTVYASGQAVSSGGQVALISVHYLRRLPPGRYTLTLWRGKHRLARHIVVIG